MGDGYNSSFRSRKDHRNSHRDSIGAGLLRSSLAQLEQSDPELAKQLMINQKEFFFNAGNGKKIESGVFMAGMSEGILEEPTKEEEDIAIHIFNQDLDDRSNQSDKVDWN